MGLRFRKSINLGGGFRLNLGKKSAGISFGTRGMRFSVNSSGRRTVTLGIPGSGIYWQKSVSGRRSKSKPKLGLSGFIIGLAMLAIVYSILKSIFDYFVQHWIVISLVVALAIVVLVFVALNRPRELSNVQASQDAQGRINLSCPKCGNQFSVASSIGSVTHTCQQCGANITVNIHAGGEKEGR